LLPVATYATLRVPELGGVGLAPGIERLVRDACITAKHAYARNVEAC
jgi:hypothetical protein